jgi:homopolymeric O-antigen transport system permease protein
MPPPLELNVSQPLHVEDSRHASPPVIYIKRSRGLVSLRLGELWQHRELLYFLIWRDVKVRYKQTALGIAWAVVQPFFTMVIFSLFFGRLAKMPSDGVPYPLFAYCALVPWGFFANGLNMGSNSLVESANLIRKVYLPRLAIPIATVLAGGVDFLVSFLLLIGMMGYYGRVPGIEAAWLPLLLLLGLVTALGVSLWLSALNVQYRDVRYTIPFLTQIWMFGTPIAYPSSLVPEAWRPFYGLNPMVGVVEGFRWALLGTATRPGAMLIVSSLAALVLLVTGAMYFRYTEKTFADVV